jgi:hypothetical protein
VTNKQLPSERIKSGRYVAVRVGSNSPHYCERDETVAIGERVMTVQELGRLLAAHPSPSEAVGSASGIVCCVCADTNPSLKSDATLTIGAHTMSVEEWTQLACERDNWKTGDDLLQSQFDRAISQRDQLQSRIEAAAQIMRGKKHSYLAPSIMGDALEALGFDRDGNEVGSAGLDVALPHRETHSVVRKSELAELQVRIDKALNILHGEQSDRDKWSAWGRGFLDSLITTLDGTAVETPEAAK